MKKKKEEVAILIYLTGTNVTKTNMKIFHSVTYDGILCKKVPEVTSRNLTGPSQENATTPITHPGVPLPNPSLAL